MKSFKLTTYLLILFFFFCLAKSSRAATINATDCSVAAINSAILSATEGDTVNVPACSETVWPTGATITKGIALKGAGIGITNIAVPDAGLGSGNFLITYVPAHPENNAAFNLSGFTFNFKNMSPSSPLSLSLLIQNYDLSHVITKVRIHHNQWLNCACQDNPLTNNGFFVTSPGVWGLFDHNYVSGEFCERSDGTSAGIDPWNNQTFSYGTASNFYWEDNTFHVHQAWSHTGASPTFTNGWGGRYAVRYNTFDLYRDPAEQQNSGLFPWFDEHGNQTSGVYASMGVEIYGNKLTTTGFTNANNINAFSIRGGKSLIFWNNIVHTEPSGYTPYKPYGTLMEEFSDLTDLTPYACSGSVAGSSCSSDGETQHVNQAYFWNNRADNFFGTNQTIDFGLAVDCATGLGGYGSDPNCRYNGGTGDVNSLLPNVQYWPFNVSFDGTSGTGCGTLASRPSTCTTGVGYWATNQSCSDLTRMIGADPATPISGTLYRCTVPNTWTAYYTPYTYPHPLRTDCANYPTLCDPDTTPPAAPTGLSVN